MDVCANCNSNSNNSIIVDNSIDFFKKNLRRATETTYRVVKNADTQFYFWDNFGNSAPILNMLSLLQAEIYGA